MVFLAALVGRELAQRLRLPTVIGEIALGCVVGPSVLGWISPTAPLEALAELGAVLLLFAAGLETRLGELKKVGKVAIAVGVGGVVLPFLMGVLWARLMGHPTPQALFIAAAFVATSAGITARVLSDLGMLGRVESRIILGAAVIDDILAMLLLSSVTAIQGGGGVDLAGLSLVLVKAVGFVVLTALLGTQLMKCKGSELLDAPRDPLSSLALSLLLCLGLAAAAHFLGLAAIIGAFLAGVLVAETRQQHTLRTQLEPLMSFLVPFFFVVTGTKVALAQLGSTNALGMLAVATLLAMVSKLLACGLGAWSLGKHSALIIGVGMIPRGEVGIIVASLGQAAGVFNVQLYAVIIAMSLLTSLIAPLALKPLLVKENDVTD